ncbi:MAG: diacylglycerol kinase [Parcubacteria group bacterium GW2011_GWA2_47_8]|nr:MAG: diacylglycerol kinase [Parcubacteria group bacterium GW2011_GWA2_47_8]
MYFDPTLDLSVLVWIVVFLFRMRAQLAKGMYEGDSGLSLAFREERSIRLMSGGALVVVFFLYRLPVTPIERRIIILAIAFAFALELINTAIERLIPVITNNARTSSVVPTLHLLSAATKCFLVGCAIVIVLTFFPYMF